MKNLLSRAQPRVQARGKYVPAGNKLSRHGALPVPSRRHQRQQEKLRARARAAGKDC